MTGRHPHQSLKLSIAAICEYALESRGRWTMVGTFRQLEFPSFPAKLERLEFYFLFTDVTVSDIEQVGIGLWRSVGEEHFAAASPLLEGATSVRRTAFPDALEAVLKYNFRSRDGMISLSKLTAMCSS